MRHAYFLYPGIYLLPFKFLLAHHPRESQCSIPPGFSEPYAGTHVGLLLRGKERLFRGRTRQSGVSSPRLYWKPSLPKAIFWSAISWPWTIFTGKAEKVFCESLPVPKFELCTQDIGRYHYRISEKTNFKHLSIKLCLNELEPQRLAFDFSHWDSF